MKNAGLSRWGFAAQHAVILHLSFSRFVLHFSTRDRPLPRSLASVSDATLPPLTTATMSRRLPRGGHAARGRQLRPAAPLGSARSWLRARGSAPRPRCPPRPRVTTSSTRARACSNVRSPGRTGSSPSARLHAPSSVTGFPAASERLISPRRRLDADDRARGVRAFTASGDAGQQPASTHRDVDLAHVGQSSAISSPTVPCPAMIQGWSKAAP